MDDLMKIAQITQPKIDLGGVCFFLLGAFLMFLVFH